MLPFPQHKKSNGIPRVSSESSNGITTMTTLPIIREARTSDLPRITEIYAYHVLNGLASFEEAAPDEIEMTRRFHSLQEKRMPYYVAELDGIVMGYAYAGPYRERIAYRYTVENSVYIAPDGQGKGLGGALMDIIIDRCSALGLRQMVSVIGDSANQASIALHKSRGFRMVGTLEAPGFKFGQWVDSILMQRALGEGKDTLPE